MFFVLQIFAELRQNQDLQTQLALSRLISPLELDAEEIILILNQPIEQVNNVDLFELFQLYHQNVHTYYVLNVSS